MQSKWEREEVLHMAVPEEVMTELCKRIEHLEQAKVLFVDSMGGAVEAFKNFTEALNQVPDIKPMKRTSLIPFSEYDECTPVVMNPYQDRLRHTQNNNWRGNGKRKKGKPK